MTAKMVLNDFNILLNYYLFSSAKISPICKDIKNNLFWSYLTEFAASWHSRFVIIRVINGIFLVLLVLRSVVLRKHFIPYLPGIHLR
jgi:hypothetical protein